jgi:outer membrane protein OmpA-like peptidoglycan-associated protein
MVPLGYTLARPREQGVRSSRMKVKMGAEPSRRQGRQQALRAAVLLCIGLLGGCSFSPKSAFHQYEGGVVAQSHAAPPGQNQPYPNLASVPPAPPPPNMSQLNATTNGLVADRAHAQYLAESAPLADPSSPQASPDLFGVGTAPPPPPAGTASASLPAATASPAAAAPPPPPAKAPVSPVQTAQLAAPPAPHAPAPAQPARNTELPSTIPSAPAEPAAGPVPAVSAAPPAPPPGIAPATATARMPEEEPGNPADSVTLAFVPGSASLSPPDQQALKQLASRRGNKIIEALGRGEATSAMPAAQETAITLGFSRAQAIAKALQADGVPEGAIQVMSLAGGRGGAAKLVE